MEKLLQSIKERGFIAVDSQLVNDYEFALLYLTLDTNKLSEDAEKADIILGDDKVRAGEKLVAEYNRHPDIVKSTGEPKPLAESTIERLLGVMFADRTKALKLEENRIKKLEKDIRAYIRRGDRMGKYMIENATAEKRNREQGLTQ